MSWAQEELEGLDLGDKRNNDRAKRLLERLGTSPRLSLPQACRGWAETKGAYRLLNQSKGTSTAETLLAPHAAATLERMRGESVVLCLNDTTQVDFTSKPDTEGLGPLTYAEQQGFYLHPLLAVSPARLCLGVLSAEWMVRDWKAHGKSRATKKSRPISEKESNRWLLAFKHVCTLAASLPGTRLVYIADREGDIYELLQEAQGAPADMIIRSSPDRALKEGGHLHETVVSTPALGTQQVSIPAKPGRPARLATLTIYSARVLLRPPYRSAGPLPPIEVTIVRAREESPPKGQEAIDWILLTNRIVVDLAAAETLISWYVCRWQIEIYFRILKTGCAIQDLQLTEFRRLQMAITFYLIVAWRIQFLITHGRICPDVPCDTLFSEEEWRVAYALIKRKPPPKDPPTLQLMIRMVAGLGGFLMRKGDGDPGPNTLWKGLQCLRNYVFAAETYAAVTSRKKGGPKGR